MKVNVKDKGILFDTPNLGIKLIELINSLPKDEDNELIFEKGVYKLNIEESIEEVVYMTNTVSEKEMSIPTRKIGIKIENANNLTLNGNGATLLYEGRMTEFYLHDCKNITIKNFIIDNRDPSVAEFDVIKKSLFSFEIKPTINSRYNIINNKLIWGCEIDGNMYVTQDCKDGVTTRVPGLCWWKNPFDRQIKASKLGNGSIKILMPFNLFKANKRYQLRNQLRDGAGCFVSRCENFVFDNNIVHFMHGMGILCQVCNNVTVTNSKFIPNKDVDRTTTAFADMVHASMCKGLVKVTNNEFDGAHDDALNVHGNHFNVEKIDDNTIKAKWMHAQAYGFDPFDRGDNIEFIDKGTLTVIAKNTVLHSKMTSLREIEIKLENKVEDNINGQALEIANKTPDLIFDNNIIKNIPTRGVLCTTRGKVKITRNKFIKTHMAGILISDDANTWYESGYVRDVEISNNLFDKCQGYVIDIFPEAHDLSRKLIVHKNIRIINNKFIMDQANILRVKRTKNLVFKDNKIEGVKPIYKVLDSEDVNIEL